MNTVSTPRRTRYFLVERNVSTGAVTHGPQDLGTDECKARHVFRNWLAFHPDRYTPHGSHRLVLLAEDGAQ